MGEFFHRDFGRFMMAILFLNNYDGIEVTNEAPWSVKEERNELTP